MCCSEAVQSLLVHHGALRDAGGEGIARSAELLRLQPTSSQGALEKGWSSSERGV